MEECDLAKESEFLSKFSFEILSAVALKSTVKDAARPSLERLTVVDPGVVEISLPVPFDALDTLSGK